MAIFNSYFDITAEGIFLLPISSDLGLTGPSFISQRQQAVADDPVELRLCLGATKRWMNQEK